MKKLFFHKEVIIQRGYVAKSFIVVIKGKALVLNSSGTSIKKQILQHQTYGLVDILKGNKWKNTVVSENNSEILFVPKEILLKNIFSSKTSTSITLNILKMAS